jgi:hypothetical protein
MTRIVETTLDIRFSADGDAYAVADCNVAGDVAAQAELLAFAHVSARTVQLVGAERGLALLQALALRDGVPPDPKPGRSAASTRVVARFLGARNQPRMFFTMKQRSSRSSPFTDTVGLAAASLEAAFAALLRRGRGGETRRRRLVTTAQLVGRFAADGVVHPQSEFDVALVAADVAWRPDVSPEHVELECPACGSQGTFERRLWPSERDTLGACTACGSGLWLRSGEPVRQLDQGIWRSMEALRDSVADDVVAARRREPRSQHPDDETARLFSQLKLVFAENRWPFAEVRDEPVLVSDLSGVWGTWKFYAQVAAEHDAVLFYSICPLRVPEDARQEAAQFLARANYGLATGNFELDFDDGEIRYKTVLLVDGELSPSGVKRAVRANGVAMETYLPGIGAVITGTPALPALERRVGA